MSIAEKLHTIAQNQQAVYDAGKQAEYDRLWDVIQDKGNRNEDYVYFFRGWDDTIFIPKYDMRLTGDNNRMFYGYKGKRGIMNMVNRGLVFDTSGITDFTNMFSSEMDELPAISTIGASVVKNIFAYASKLVTVEKLELKSDGSQTFTNAFLQCPALQNLVIEGCIGQNGFNVSPANKLTVDSLMSIINALAVLPSGTTHTVTLGTTNLNKLTDVQKAIATQKGWTLA